MKITMLKCGCAGMTTHGKAHDGLEANHRSCIIHETCVPIETPSFEGRKARCSYYGRSLGRKNECSTCRDGNSCSCETDSSEKLAFFKFRGDDSKDASGICVCGELMSNHWPLWEVKIRLTRRWYKIDPYIDNNWSRRRHLPDQETAEKWAENERVAALNRTKAEETKIYSAEIISLKSSPTKVRCAEPKEHGAFPYDEYYCGCFGWD